MNQIRSIATLAAVSYGLILGTTAYKVGISISPLFVALAALGMVACVIVSIVLISLKNQNH